MRKTAVLTFALVVLTLALIGCAAADSTNDHVIQVSGSGSVTGTPDRVQINFAVQTENADVRIAQSNNALAMNNVMDALAASGVPRDEIKTTGYSIT
ncbi:MAG: SIMPL domain-containing protein, partial [Methanoregula sp.]